MNARFGYKPLSFFQTDIDLSGVVKPSTGPNITTQFLQHLIDTKTDAMAFLTVYPFQGFDKVTDAQIKDLADRVNEIVKSGRGVFIRYAPEMNGNWFPYGQDAKGFIASWKKVYTTVKTTLGPNSSKTAFIWSPNSGNGYPYHGGAFEPFRNGTAGTKRIRILDTDGNGELDASDDPYQPYYPGDDTVDFVGMSIYHYGSVWPWHDNVLPVPGQFESFLDGTESNTGSGFYAMFSGPNGCNASAGNKPMIISETAATYHMSWSHTVPKSQITDLGLELNFDVNRTAVKQTWWRSYINNDTFATTFPRIKAVCHFEFVKDEELTMRDFSTFGPPPFGNDDDNDVVKALAADLAQDQRFVWAKSLDGGVKSNRTGLVSASVVLAAQPVTATVSSVSTKSSGVVGARLSDASLFGLLSLIVLIMGLVH
ncbi:hypothetical protein HDU76_007461, partial [Blyttiomyces sp. JEL0837]